MFRNREDAGCQLADCLKRRHLRNPLVLAIPRGGLAVGAIIAHELSAELDVVLSRKLRAPQQPELATGAIAEGGEVHLNRAAEDALGVNEDYLGRERRHQLAEITRLKELFRHVRPKAEVAGRSVIVTDDGIATGSTMVAALQSLRPQSPYEVIVAVPVASPDRLRSVRRWCDDVICLLAPDDFFAIGQFYRNFEPVEIEEVVRLLREFGMPHQPASTSAARVVI
jgi:predicted phosphoribosyltransferase